MRGGEARRPPGSAVRRGGSAEADDNWISKIAQADAPSRDAGAVPFLGDGGGELLGGDARLVVLDLGRVLLQVHGGGADAVLVLQRGLHGVDAVGAAHPRDVQPGGLHRSQSSVRKYVATTFASSGAGPVPVQ